MKSRRLKIVFLFALFCAVGCTSGLLFREAGVVTEWKWPLFIAGNLFGITSTWIMMKIYAAVKNANLANLYASSISFLFGQLLMWLLFHSRLNGPQVVGLAVVFSGIIVCGFGKLATEKLRKEAEQ